MSSIIFFLIFVPVLSIILLGVNFIFAPHNPYKEKKTPFECGYHSFLSQNRTQFTISFFIFALLFLIFDLEIVLIYPYTVSSYANNIYGLVMMIVFTLIVTVGFIFELGKNALKIESKQTQYIESKSEIKALKPLQSGLGVNLNFKYILKLLCSIVLVFGFILLVWYSVDLSPLRCDSSPEPESSVTPENISVVESGRSGGSSGGSYRGSSESLPWGSSESLPGGSAGGSPQSRSELEASLPDSPTMLSDSIKEEIAMLITRAENTIEHIRTEGLPGNPGDPSMHLPSAAAANFAEQFAISNLSSQEGFHAALHFSDILESKGYDRAEIRELVNPNHYTVWGKIPTETESEIGVYSPVSDIPDVEPVATSEGESVVTSDEESVVTSDEESSKDSDKHTNKKRKIEELQDSDDNMGSSSKKHK